VLSFYSLLFVEMFSKSFIALFLLALTSSVNVHAAIAPALGNTARSDLQYRSPIPEANGFNLDAYGSRSIKRAQLNGTGKGAPKAAALPSKSKDTTPATSGAAKDPKQSADKSAVKADQKSSGKKDDKDKKGDKGKKDDKDKKDKKKDGNGNQVDVAVKVDVAEKKDDKKGKKDDKKGKKDDKKGKKDDKRTWSSRPLSNLA